MTAGNWSIWLQDVEAGEEGSFRGWSLNLTPNADLNRSVDSQFCLCSDSIRCDGVENKVLIKIVKGAKQGSFFLFNQHRIAITKETIFFINGRLIGLSD